MNTLTQRQHFFKTSLNLHKMKPDKTNSFSYKTSTGRTYGFFNIYQGRNGFIYLQMGNKYVVLKEFQILDLGIDVYELQDFDYDLYQFAYLKQKVN